MRTDNSDSIARHSSTTDEFDPTSPLSPLARVGALVVVLIRHAERVTNGADPALSAAGQARAKLLGRMLEDASVKGVYVTQFLRSRQTGKPTAALAGVGLTAYEATSTTALAATIIASHRSGTVLVVAHSNTVDDIADALGALGAGELAEAEFDRMFILARRWCGTTLLRLRYGADAH
jgi:broad specificity phosphatase PhoE